MPRKISDSTKEQVLALYHQGETVPAIARQAGVSESWVVKFVRETLGHAGTCERPRRPAPRLYALPPEVRATVPELYRRLGSIEKVALELEVDPGTIRHQLHSSGEPVRAQQRPREKCPEVYCRVCGELIPAKRCYYGARGVIVPARTCGKPECRAALLAGAVPAEEPVSRKEIRNDKGGWAGDGQGNFVRRQRLEELLLVERLPVDLEQLAAILPVEQRGEYEALFELAEDRRGVRRAANQASIWGDLSRVPVYMRLVSRLEGHSAIRLVLHKAESVFDRFTTKFFADTKQLVAVSKSFRPLLAWRCSCPKQTTWTLDTALDLPEREGLYGLCPVCGACALNIWRED
jgi:transposase-like protein